MKECKKIYKQVLLGFSDSKKIYCILPNNCTKEDIEERINQIELKNKIKIQIL